MEGEKSLKRAAIISAILDNPKENQRLFNSVVSEFQDMIRGRMGIPFEEKEIAMISLAVIEEIDEINKFTGKLGKLNGVNVKAVFARDDINFD